jgi:hypothetical protein
MLAEVICNHTKRRTPWTKVTIGHRSVWVEWFTRRTYRNYGERLEGGGPFWLGFWRLVGVTSGVTREPRGPVDFSKIEHEMMNKLTNSTIPIVPCGSKTSLTYYRKKKCPLRLLYSQSHNLLPLRNIYSSLDLAILWTTKPKDCASQGGWY